MPLDVVILGPPGAGKGTQADLISEEAGIPHIATGDMIRTKKEEDTDLGRELKAIYDRGDLVSDGFMIELMRERLSQEDTANGFVLDGFPRTLVQAEALDRLLEDLGRGVSLVLLFELPEEQAEQRLLGRAQQQARADDTPDVIRHRIEVQRVPDVLIEHYRAKGSLVGIHADRSVEDVFDEVQDVLEAATA